jgi:hypothetical protein
VLPDAVELAFADKVTDEMPQSAGLADDHVRAKASSKSDKTRVSKTSP